MNFLNSKHELKVSVKEFDINFFAKEETLMAIGNGEIVSRGTNDESNSVCSRETYINGFFNSNRDHEVEELVNIPDVFEFYLYVNGVKLEINSSNIKEYEKSLDLRYGILNRSFTVVQNEIELSIETSKYFAMDNKKILHQCIALTANKDCEVKLLDKIDGQYTNQGVEHFVYDEKYVEDGILKYYTETTDQKKIYITSRLAVDAKCRHNFSIKRKRLNRETILDLSAGSPVKLEKTTVFSQNDFAFEDSDFVKHQKIWDELWAQARTIVTGNKLVQQAIDFSTYHLIINSNLDDEMTNLGAKGMTGFGYKGHTFWDTEIFLLPFYIANFPQKAQSLLKYRTNSLEQAQNKAKLYGFEGAMFPWEGTRPECVDATPQYGPINISTGRSEKIENAEKEIHVNSAVVYGFELYLNYTGDIDFTKKYGASVLVDVAKFWLSRLSYNEEQDIYEILDVVGPDEYKEHVNNNMYTNYTAKRTIELVYEWYDRGIVAEEDVVWFNNKNALEITTKIKLQKPNEHNIIGQDDSYLDLNIIDLSKFKNSKKVGEINKVYSMAEKCEIQVGKQADLLLLFQMYRDQFDKITVEDNFVYYEDKCLHDSSLSLVTHNIISCDLGRLELASEFFYKSFEIDYLGDLSSSDEGIHFASMGGHWLSLVRGFCNVYIGKMLEIAPKLPQDIEGVEFKMFYQNQQLRISISHKMLVIANLGDKTIECLVYNKKQVIKGGDQIEITRG